MSPRIHRARRMRVGSATSFPQFLRAQDARLRAARTRRPGLHRKAGRPTPSIAPTRRSSGSPALPRCRRKTGGDWCSSRIPPPQCFALRDQRVRHLEGAQGRSRPAAGGAADERRKLSSSGGSGVAPMVRLMPYEEAMMWAEASRGVRFGALCEMLATFETRTAPLAAAGYLQGWLENEMLTSARRP